ncbi:hypothetical protein A3F00_03885 [Candidatus Daviesbacteria bacterium RIFCSPHIGHO2_12_FULL_37_11]|uniref:Uncharacterized protein n=1 Tax=Candidatus Daviesbacteria bacterium RIFCSPHIGHO2_12_FULL_37_11 TaxID=1797777 RepID=A0A1F5KC69_9BACT|nr:MAG: hypothetical protein A3F00_03885 [Candidatus Daviesbacteria bacterium RIFCSPHIGHO2_12_FULL_37_11]OGE45893.1 MAG: hypothetical protein A3B39_01670 [Candidatus Daviesbacteria bacterium RIFCSPLOWO2_01_FULL_37_10]
MAGININLLPVQSRIDQKVQKKFRIVQTASIATLLVLFFLASLISALNILKLKDISELKSEADLSEERVLVFKDKEAELSVLKNRLSLINQVHKTKVSENSLIYRNALNYVSPEVNISSISVDRSGNVLTSIAAPDISSLEQTFSNLTSDKAFEEISQIDIDSLSRSRDGIYRANIRLQN